MTEGLLDRYNALRKSHGKPPFMKWTGSTEELQDAFNHENGGTEGEVVTPSPRAKKKASSAKKTSDKSNGQANSKQASPKGEETTKKKAEPKKEGVSLADICREVKTDPRAARIKLRAAYRKSKDHPATIGETWTWAKNDVPKIKAILTAKDEPKK